MSRIRIGVGVVGGGRASPDHARGLALLNGRSPRGGGA